jgi:hypothetical protein
VTKSGCNLGQKDPFRRFDVARNPLELVVALMRLLLTLTIPFFLAEIR